MPAHWQIYAPRVATGGRVALPPLGTHKTVTLALWLRLFSAAAVTSAAASGAAAAESAATPGAEHRGGHPKMGGARQVIVSSVGGERFGGGITLLIHGGALMFEVTAAPTETDGGSRCDPPSRSEVDALQNLSLSLSLSLFLLLARSPVGSAHDACSICAHSRTSVHQFAWAPPENAWAHIAVSYGSSARFVDLYVDRHFVESARLSGPPAGPCP